jgi:hypothetical protein
MIGARVIRAALPGRHSGGMLDSLAPARRRRARRVSIHTGLAARGHHIDRLSSRPRHHTRISVRSLNRSDSELS